MEDIAIEKKRFLEKKVNEELEKVEIATVLCNSCTLDQMRYLKAHASIIIKKLRK